MLNPLPMSQKRCLTPFNKWYVIDYITQNNLQNYKEFYICWIPKMIDSAKEILINNWIKKEKIFTEKY